VLFPSTQLHADTLSTSPEEKATITLVFALGRIQLSRASSGGCWNSLCSRIRPSNYWLKLL